MSEIRSHRDVWGWLGLENEMPTIRYQVGKMTNLSFDREREREIMLPSQASVPARAQQEISTNALLVAKPATLP